MKYNSIKNLLFKLVLKQRCPHSFIFYGLNFSKIERISKEVAFKILQIEKGNSIDLIEFKTDKKSISVDEIRVLNHEILKKPEISKNKVIIIYDSHKMTIEAQNSFLKSLEDVAENTFIILIAKNIDNIVNTILSRCLIIKFGKLDYEEYKEDFKDIELNNEELYNTYIQSQGNIDISRSILNKDTVYKMYVHILNILKCYSDKDLIGVFELENQIHSFKDCIDLYISLFISLLRDVLIFSEFKDGNLIYNKIFQNDIINLETNFSVLNIERILEQLIILKNRIISNMNFEVCNKIFILNIFKNEEL